MNTLAPHLSTDPDTPITAPQLPESAALVARMQVQTSEVLEKMMAGKEGLRLKEEQFREIIKLIRELGDSYLMSVGDLIEKSKDVNVKDKDGRTALMWASGDGSIEVVKLCLAHPEIEVNTKDTTEWTPLIRTVIFGHIEIVTLLLAHPRFDLTLHDQGKRAMKLAKYPEIKKMIHDAMKKQGLIKKKWFFF